MTAITFHVEAQSDVKFIEQLAKKMNIPYEKSKDKSPYNPKFVAKIKKGEQEIKDGKGISIAIDDLWK
ncbi:MAG: hypothetical protein RL308_2472 [Bacteroidota bacterium]|jgi:hypothetical protein